MTFRMGLCCCTCEVVDNFNVDPQEDYVPAGFTKVGEGSLDIVPHPDPSWVGPLGNILKITGAHTGFVSSAEYERLDYRVRLYDVFGEVDKTCQRRLVIWWEDEDNYVALEDEWSALTVHPTNPGVTTSSRSFVRLIRRENGVDTILKFKWFPFATSDDPTTVGSLAVAYQTAMIDIFYDAASGWFAWKSDAPLLLNGGYGGQYKFDPPLGPGRIGVVTGGTAETPTAIDDLTVYTSRCQDHLAWWQCDQAKFLWPDEINLRIEGMGTTICPGAPGLNGEYVLQRSDETDLSKFPYRVSAPVGAYGGVVYSYTLPSAICNVVQIDVWFGGPLTFTASSEADQQPWVVLYNNASLFILLPFSRLDVREAIDEEGDPDDTDCREVRWANDGAGFLNVGNATRVEIWF